MEKLKEDDFLGFPKIAVEDKQIEPKFPRKVKTNLGWTDVVEYYNEKDDLHREDGPAVEYANGKKEWFKNGERHREDGPAIEHANGEKHWYKNGKFHREDGPAVEYANGAKCWYKNGQIHREDGPAIEYADNNKEYWYNNIDYPEINSDKEWASFISKLKSPLVGVDSKKPIEAEAKVISSEKNKDDSFSEMFKSDLTKASYGVAATQIVDAIQMAIFSIIKSSGVNSSQFESIKLFLSTPFGKSLISYCVGMFIANSSIESLRNEKIQYLGNKFREQGMEIVGNQLVSFIMQNFLPIVANSVAILSEENKVRVESIQNDFINEELEEEKQYCQSKLRE